MTIILPSPCPNCGYVMDECTSLSDRKSPEAGDWSFCLACGSPNVFTVELSLRACTEAELAKVPLAVRWKFEEVRRTIITDAMEQQMRKRGRRS